eukprot:386-Rhodomonas_salina.4
MPRADVAISALAGQGRGGQDHQRRPRQCKSDFLLFGRQRVAVGWRVRDGFGSVRFGSNPALLMCGWVPSVRVTVATASLSRFVVLLGFSRALSHWRCKNGHPSRAWMLGVVCWVRLDAVLCASAPRHVASDTCLTMCIRLSIRSRPTWMRSLSSSTRHRPRP